MNSIQTLTRVQFYCDVTRNARYERYEIDTAVSDAMRVFIDQIIDDEKNKRSVSKKDPQVASDSLYTLQKRQSAAPVASIALLPTDYYSLLDVYATLNGISKYCRPLDQNKLGPRLDNAFDPPSADAPFYLQQATGFQIYYGTSTITNVDIDYYKVPATFTIGTDSQLINSGAGVLTNATSYIATEVSVHNSITYNVGAQFTSANTNLTSGQVILAANTTPIELPGNTHEIIAKMASSILLGVTSDFPKSQFTQVQADKG